MSVNSQINLSKFCGRKLNDEEGARIQEVAASMELMDDDALWPLLAIIEFQKTYYEKIPTRIENALDKLLESIKKSTEKKVEKSQVILAESVLRHAKELTLSTKIKIITPQVLAGIIIQFCYGVMMLLADITILGNGFYQLMTIFRHEIGPILMGTLFVSRRFSRL